MNNLNFEKEVKLINSIKFMHLDGIKCGELLATNLFYEPKIVSLNILFKKLVFTFLNSYLILETNRKNGNIAFFFTPSYASRQDHYNDFMAVTSCVENPIIFNGRNTKLIFSFKRIIGLFYWFIWLITMIKNGFSLNRCVQMCNILLQAYYVVEELKIYRLDKNLIKLAVTFCDVHPCDYLITQYFNKLGIKTATLQHAIFFHGTQFYCYRFSHSRYFLATSDYCKNEAIKSCYKGNIKVVGPMKAIYMSKSFNIRKKRAENSQAFGLALCGPTFKDQNKSLFDYAEHIQNKFNLSVIIRFHPALKKEDYESAIRKLKKVKISNESVNEFASSCDFVILGATNMFAELISFDTPTFRVISNGIDDIYEGIDDFCFMSEEQLDKLIALKDDKEKMQTIMNRVKKYLCPEGDVGELYKKTLKKISLD